MSLIQHMVQYQFFNLTKKKNLKGNNLLWIVNTCTLPVVLKDEALQLKKKLKYIKQEVQNEFLDTVNSLFYAHT